MATWTGFFGAIGSHLTKNFSELDLFGTGSTGRMSGFYFTDNQQHLGPRLPSKTTWPSNHQRPVVQRGRCWMKAARFGKV